MTPEPSTAKPTNKYILYVIAGVAAVAIGAIAIYYYFSSSNPGSTSVTTCQNNATSLLTAYGNQYQAYLVANNYSPLSAAQEAQLSVLYNNYQTAEAQCLQTATSLQDTQDFYNNVIPVAIGVAIAAVIGAVGYGYYQRITSKLAKPPALPSNATSAMEQSVNADSVASGAATPEQGNALAQGTGTRGATNAASDNSIFGNIITRLKSLYQSEGSNLDDVEEDLTTEQSVNLTMVSETGDIISLLP